MADDRDMTAAEYVLGTLPEPERAAAAARFASDPAFAAAVRAWEDRLAPLDRETAPVVPPPRLWDRLRAAIETEAVVPRVDLGARLADAAGPVAEVIALSRRLARWRVTAVAAARSRRGSRPSPWSSGCPAFCRSSRPRPPRPAATSPSSTATPPCRR